MDAKKLVLASNTNASNASLTYIRPVLWHTLVVLFIILFTRNVSSNFTIIPLVQLGEYVMHVGKMFWDLCTTAKVVVSIFILAGANLPQVLNDGEYNLYLCLKLSSSCHRCGGKGHGWSYRSHCKTYHLHVSCVKELLVENWQAMYLNVDKNKVREMQTRIPSLKGTLKNYHGHGAGRGGKVSKCCQIAGGAVRVIVSAILGDPTAIIAAVVGGFISK